jgi:DNA-binding transcriptional regulator LsrR (DeoR family)
MSRERSQLQKIARLYYVEELNQRQIADRLSISMASVSRGLSRAKELGIVKISIVDAADSYTDLEVLIEGHWGIRECVVTPAFEKRENTYRAFAAALAEVFPRVLPREGLVGVSWGETLKALGDELRGVESLRAGVVPLIGAMGTVETGIFPNSIARSFAERLGGSNYLVNAPAVLDSRETADRLVQDSTFDQVRDLWQRIDVAVLGAGPVDEKTSMYRGGVFTATELEKLRATGSEAATNFLFVSAEGAVVHNPLSGRIVCLAEEQMRRIPTVIVAAGGPEKSAAIAAVLRSGLVHILITDAETARELAAMAGSPE